MCSGFGRRAGQVGRQKIPVVLTAVTNTPSYEASRLWKAASMTRREGSTGTLIRSFMGWFMGSMIAQPGTRHYRELRVEFPVEPR